MKKHQMLRGTANLPFWRDPKVPSAVSDSKKFTNCNVCSFVKYVLKQITDNASQLKCKFWEYGRAALNDMTYLVWLGPPCPAMSSPTCCGA